MIVPIILSGGNGTRLWPLSRKMKPKQFINLFDDKTIFTKTIKRFCNKKVFKNPIILGNINHEELINEEIQNNNLNDSKIILEPLIKNTAPAVASIIQYLINNKKKDDIVVFLPSDAYIDNIEDFENYLVEGEKIAKQDKVVCFGVQPFYPETGYGYIKIGDKIGGSGFLVDKFVEKPNIEKALEFIKTGNYLWNAGIFMAKVSFLYKLFEKYQSNLLTNIKKTLDSSKELDNKIYLDKENFNNCEEISIDYAIIEHLNSENLAVISMNLAWNDIGSFKSLFDINKNKTLENNILSGKVVVSNTENCFIKSSKKIICCSDVDDLVIIEEDDLILVMKKDKSQNIKKLIEKCKVSNLETIL